MRLALLIWMWLKSCESLSTDFSQTLLIPLRPASLANRAGLCYNMLL